MISSNLGRSSSTRACLPAWVTRNGALSRWVSVFLPRSAWRKRSLSTSGSSSGSDSSPVCVPELLGQVHDDRLVPEHAAQAVVAAGADDADQPVLDLDHRDVERAAAEVVDQDGLVFALLQAVGDGRGGRLVEDRADVQPGEPAGVGGRLALGRCRSRPGR